MQQQHRGLNEVNGNLNNNRNSHGSVNPNNSSQSNFFNPNGKSNN